MEDRGRKTRLSRSAEFERVYRHGRSASHRLLVVYRLDRPDDVHVDPGTCRIGLTVSRKVGSAVTRNKIKRQLREAIDRAQIAHPSSDFVFVVRPGLPEAMDAQDFPWLVGLVVELVSKLAGATTSPDVQVADEQETPALVGEIGSPIEEDGA